MVQANLKNLREKFDLKVEDIDKFLPIMYWLRKIIVIRKIVWKHGPYC